MGVDSPDVYRLQRILTYFPLASDMFMDLKQLRNIKKSITSIEACCFETLYVYGLQRITKSNNFKLLPILTHINICHYLRGIAHNLNIQA